jgi:hypothetical protein
MLDVSDDADHFGRLRTCSKPDLTPNRRLARKQRASE